ncbi:hypothetical protein L21SP5_01731 [Salinivirga cyanobacteriivorans]|uniref:Uncharacterized protein n=1 Tax=Salinivirga cyanobacteriivorans TaxID=1307839 RepID=A0A0S2HZE8_9BACT|nr:T9SS type A sorting domain-containing protein [Salinivirga cyanobacteriivorans]ALO15373.1 hypothetical protein L21SP5_01731 [Salinivirga cyanobacteriivorans]
MMNDFTLRTYAKTLFVFIATALLSLSATGQTVLFSDDFNGSFPGEWTNNVIAGPAGFPGWEWTDVGGDYGGQLNSTTSGNGYLILDSDQYGETGTPEEADLISPSIDCSDKDIIQFSVEHWARSYGNADITISISTDNFNTEDVIYNWVGAQNDANGTNQVISNFDISEYAAGESNVKIKFKWQGEWDFWWLIDDIEVTGLEVPSGNITDLVYWLRGDLGVTGATPVTNWADQSGNGNDATPGNGPDQITSSDMNNQQVMAFDGNDELNIANNPRINGGTGYDGRERTMFVAFQTGADIATTQYIYEEGGSVNGIGVYIKNGNLYLNIYNDNASNRITLHETINANTTYILIFNWDNGTFGGYLNNIPFSNQTPFGTITNLKQHTGDISIGYTGGTTRNETGGTHGSGNNFTGEIAEILYYDASLLEEEVLDISLELADRYGISFDPVTTYYSYQTGDWDASSTWTHDPGGTTQTATDVPGDNDIVVLLSGRTVTLNGNVTQSNLDVTIRAGATLNQSTYTFTNGLLALAGTGTFKLASTDFPSVSTNDFVGAEGGTTEYYNDADFTLPAAQTEYNNLRINAPGVAATQLSNITLNGNLHVKQGTYQINDNSANRRQLTINGNVLVDNGASITTGTGNTVSGDEGGGTAPFTDYYDKNSHRVVVYGDFTNNGTVKFTNQNYPEYNAFPTDGMATVYFMGTTNNTLTANGTSDFYNLVLDKGIDKTYKLTVYSTDYSNFRLFGRNNIGGQNPGPNPDLRKALWIRTGTLELTGLTVIPSLVEGTDCGSSPNSDYYIPANGALVLNGPEVIVLTTADTHEEINLAYGVSAGNDGDCGVATGGCTSFSILGKLQVNDGYFSTRESGGIITWDDAAGELIINGGIVDVKQYRSAGSSGGLASFTQSGGTFLLRGRFQRTPTAFSAISNLKDFSSNTLNTNRVTDGLNGSLATFNINEPANVFAMSGGTIRIYDVCGTGDSEAFQVFSSDANNSVSGGTLEIIPTTGTGTDATEFYIETTADLGNLTINRASSSASVDLKTHDLTVLNDITITSGDFNANNLDLTIGGDFTLASGTSYTPGANTTTFNGTKNQQLTINLASAQSFNDFILNNSSGNKLTLSGTQSTINIDNTLTIQKGELADNGKTINVTGDIYNAGTHSGDGKIVLNGSADQAINGSGNGTFGNIELNNTAGSTAPVSLEANATINGTLTFSQDKLFDISTHKLTFGQTATVANAGTDRFIRTAGNAGDGGVTKTYTASATSFTFPVGTISTSHAAAEYTPANLSFGTNPNTFGNITVVPVGYEHPNTTTKDRSLTYFWRVKSEGFDMGSATVNHAYTYSQNDVVTGGDVSEDGYIAAIYDNNAMDWTTYAVADVDESTNIIGGTTTALEAVSFIDGEFTAGDNDGTDPFGVPVKFYSVADGFWGDASTWSFTSGGTPGAGIPGENDIVVIENNHTVELEHNGADYPMDYDVRNCASLLIEDGAVLDIKSNTSSIFSIVLNHPNGNGLIRVTTEKAANNSIPQFFSFPSGDFSDFNTNGGTTEYYDIDGTVGALYILPSDVTSYGNLILSAKGGDNVVLPNNSETIINGDLTCSSIDNDTRAWIAMEWNTDVWPYNSNDYNPVIEKTVHVKGNLNVNAGTFIFLNNEVPQHLIVDENITIDSDALMEVYPGYPFANPAQPNTVKIGGSLINNNVAEFKDGDFYCDVTFFGSGTANITNTEGAPTTTFNKLTIDKGNTRSDELIVDIEGTLNTPTDNWLTLVNGTFKYLHDDDLTITEGSEFTIPSTAGLFVNSPGNTVYLANDNVNDNDVYLQGKLTVVDGDVYVGQTWSPNNNNDIEYSGGGDSEIDIQGGSLTVNGQIRRNPSTSAGILKYSQSGGDVTINGRNHNTDNAKLEILNAGSEFNMSGGTLTIERGGGAGTYGDLYLRPEISSVTGGEIIFNPDDVNEDQNYIFDANVPVWNLTINGTDGYNANLKLLVSPLTLKNDMLINSAGTLDANVNFDIPVTIKGDFTNNGTYTHQRNLTTFSGGEQAVLGSSNITFHDLIATPVTSLALSKDITVNNDLTLTSGTLICGDYYTNVEGDVTNNANYTDNTTGIVLNGRDQQNIQGTGTWGQLELDNAAGARLESEITLQNDFILTKGVFDINSKLLTLLENSDIVGSDFSNTKMIASDGVYSDVGISKVFSSAYNGVTYLYPLGTSNKYTPAEITITNIDNTGSIRINNINENHPGVIDENNVLNYFWDIESTGVTNFSGTIELNYLDDDVQVTGTNTEADYIAAHLLIPGSSWSKASPGAGTDNVDESNNIITFNFSNAGSLSGEYTTGIDAALPDQVPEFTSNQSGNWSNPDIWDQTDGDSYTLTGAPNGFIINIKEGHTVTTDANYASAYRISIEGKLAIDNSTYGHNIGLVSGSGTLYLENGTFPAGRYSTFFDCTNNSTLEYGGSTDYALIADLYSTVANLHFTGTGARTLPNKDLSICNQILIDGPTVDNSVNNSKLTIQGTMERYNSGAFISGTGADATVTFAGTSEQTIGGALGDFNGSNAFNNLKIDNSNGLTINNNGDIEVSGKLMLTDGNINTTATNQLTITNTNSDCIVPAGGQSNSFVDGPLKKSIIQGDNFNFPIGKDGELGNKLVLSASEAGTIEWTVEYFTPNDTYTSYNTPLSYVNSYDRWSVSAAPGSKANVGIKWDANSDLTPANTENGLADMRVAKYDEGNSVWNELTSSASGGTNLGTVTTVGKITIPAGGYSLFSSACINTIKPRAKFTPSGPVCGTSGIPVSFSSSPSLDYVLSYTLDGVPQPDITVSSTPYTLPTQAGGGVYKLVSFTYDGGKTGAVDQSEITAYEQPAVPDAGLDQSICGGTQANISGSAPGVGSVLWSVTSGAGGSIVSPTSESTVFNGTNGSGYTLTYTVDNGGCTASDDVNIDFPVLAAQPGDFLVSSSDVCQTESGVEYTVPDDATVNYTWTFDNNGNTGDGNDNLAISGSGNSITADFSAVTGDGTLQVVASNACGDSDPRTIDIAIHPMPVVNLTNDDPDGDNTICNGSTIEFTATENSGSGLSVADYEFLINGAPVQSGLSDTYSTGTLSNGDQVEVVITSDASCATTSSAQTISVGDRVWDGSTSTDWSVADNWSCGDVPANTDEIVIPGSAATMPEILANAECGGLTVESGATITVQGTNNFDIYGNWNNYGTFDGATGTVNIKGNASLNGSAELTINNLTIDNGVTLTASGNNLNITGDLTNNGAFAHNNGTVSFNGTNAQSISGDFTGTSTLNNVVIDNAAGVNLASGNKQIDGTLNLTNGLLESNGLLTLGQNATTNVNDASGQVTSYVNGVLSKIILGNDDFFFPIGDGAAYKPVGVSAENAPGTNTWTAQYNNVAPAEHPIQTGSEIIRVSNAESWTVTSSGGDARVTISWNNLYDGNIYVDSDQLNSLRVAHLNNSSEWVSTGSGSTTGAGGDFGTVTSGDIVVFDGAKAGPETFTLSTTNDQYHLLPVELLSFTGKDDGGIVKLNWVTASETNNDYFAVQHSTDATNYSTIGTVSGAGNSVETNNYDFTHYQPANGINYYRLKQVDFDGNFEIHQTIAVHTESLSLVGNESFKIYPNPYSEGDLTLEIENVEANSQIILSVLNMTGDVLFNDKISVPANKQIVNYNELTNLEPGLYLIHMKFGNEVAVKRLIVY